ncbi:hypothetical protein UQ64_03375 [Paenibacillus etheri]|uniref:Uncharacterized protein n=1 Tax=Paenibacillus etheri TaxID=1306852 RepID=A0A0W1API6_9BACL|nr:hypothetical protein UQ64_03375 [Paenibacillus etheri]
MFAARFQHIGRSYDFQFGYTNAATDLFKRDLSYVLGFIRFYLLWEIESWYNYPVYPLLNKKKRQPRCGWRSYRAKWARVNKFHELAPSLRRLSMIG